MNKKPRNIIIPSAVVLSASVVFTVCAAYAVFQHNLIQIYSENALIENIQALILAITSMVYLANATLGKRSDKLIMLFCSVLCLSFLLRELDVERLAVPQLLITLGSGMGRTVILTLAFFAILSYGLLNFSYYMQAALAFTRSKAGWALFAGGALLITGEIFERSGSLIEHHVFFEELGELWGYSLILVSSIYANSFMGELTLRSNKPGES